MASRAGDTDAEPDALGNWALLMRVLADERTIPFWPLLGINVGDTAPVVTAARKYLLAFDGYDLARTDIVEWRTAILSELGSELGEDVVEALRRLERVGFPERPNPAMYGARAARDVVLDPAKHAGAVPLDGGGVEKVRDALSRHGRFATIHDELVAAESLPPSPYVRRLARSLGGPTEEPPAFVWLPVMIDAFQFEDIRRELASHVTDDEWRALVAWWMT